MQVLSVRGVQRFMIQPRVSFRLKVETDSNNTAFQGEADRSKPSSLYC